MVVVCSVLLYLLAIRTPVAGSDAEEWKPDAEVSVYYFLLLAASVTGDLAGNACNLALLKDWLVVMTEDNKKALVHLNASTRRIDLLCQVHSIFS